MKSIARWAGGVLAVAVGWLAQVQGVVAGGGGAGWTYQLNGNSLWGSGPQCIPTLLGSNLLCSSSEGASHNQGALFLKEAFPVSGVGLSMPLYQFGAISNDGAYPIGNTPEQFAEQIRAEYAVYKKVVETAKLKLE